MKPLSVSEIRQLDIKSLQSKADEFRTELFRLKLKRKTTGLDKPHMVGVIKKNIARTLMVLGEKSKE